MCVLRKKKGFCFLILGLVYVEEDEKEEDIEEEFVFKFKKRKKKKFVDDKMYDVMDFNENEFKLKFKKGISVFWF